MKVSIITVCYNSVATIEHTLLSVKKLKAVDKNIEYIVIDGKSEDGTNKIISRYTDVIDHYISEPDSGMYDALNKGIRISSSNWVMLLAADDCIISNCIEKFRNTLKEDTEIWCGSIICKDGEDYYIENSEPNLEKLKDSCVLRNPASIFNKKVFEKYGYYDTDFKCNGDGELFYRMFINKVKFQIENIPMVVFAMEGMSSYDVTKYAIPERSMIYRKYNLMTDEEVLRWEKKSIKRGRIKQILKKNPLVNMISKRGKSSLSRSELKEMGVEI